MQAAIVLNSAAGNGAARPGSPTPDDLVAAFADAGIRTQLLLARPGQLDAVLREAIGQRPDAVIVGGGDGTLSAAAGHLAGTGLPLGVLPLGTLNHFAKDLGVPVDWRDAVRSLAHASPREIDVGDLNGRVFLNNCSLGLYAEAVRRRDALRAQKGWGKWPAMFLASCTVFRRLRRMRLQVRTAAGITDLRTPLVVVSNNRYTGHLLDGSVRARLDEGQLWLHTTRVHGRFTLFRLALQTLRRRLDDVDHLETQPLTDMTITAPHDIPVAADGELLPPQPSLRIRIRPRALRVLAPPPPAA